MCWCWVFAYVEKAGLAVRATECWTLQLQGRAGRELGRLGAVAVGVPSCSLSSSSFLVAYWRLSARQALHPTRRVQPATPLPFLLILGPSFFPLRTPVAARAHLPHPTPPARHGMAAGGARAGCHGCVPRDAAADAGVPLHPSRLQAVHCAPLRRRSGLHLHAPNHRGPGAHVRQGAPVCARSCVRMSLRVCAFVQSVCECACGWVGVRACGGVGQGRAHSWP